MRILIERRRRLVQMFMLSIMTMIMYRRHIPRMLIVNRDEERRSMLKRMYRESDRLCHEQLRMKRSIFLRLCSRLRGYGLRNSRHLDVEEQVALFLNTVGHDKRNRSSCFGFLRSGHTVSIYFHRVLSSILRLHNDIVKPATEANSPANGGSHRSWHHHFQDAVGAIDGTHVKATVAEADQARYRNRLNFISQNVLVACTFDMKFTYVLAGWEGSAHDGRLLRSAVSRNGSRLTVPNGKYYLADAGFPLVPKLLTPYRGTRYHLRDVAGQRPTNEKELFNFRHSSLRHARDK